MARYWHIWAKNTETGVEIRDNVNYGVLSEVEHLAKHAELGRHLRTRRPEVGETVHEYEHGTVKVSRNNPQTVPKRRGVLDRSTGIRI